MRYILGVNCWHFRTILCTYCGIWSTLRRALDVLFGE